MTDSLNFAIRRDRTKSIDWLHFSRSRTSHALNTCSPAPLIPRSLTTFFLVPTNKPGFAKSIRAASASSLKRIGYIERVLPTTHDSMLPPYSSGLSISDPRHSQASQPGTHSTLPLAAATTGCEYFPKNEDRCLSTTPIKSSAPSDIDHSLTSRFEKVEMIGTGEYSCVYRVTQSAMTHPSTAHSYHTLFFGTSGSPSTGNLPSTPMPDRVFAVKKSRQPYQGIKDRRRKLQEVNVLKALGQSDHVVELIDSWEEKNYLYIQTELCEEGSLAGFLSTVGRRGRLDDFRIWKIMWELCQVIFFVLLCLGPCTNSFPGSQAYSWFRVHPPGSQTRQHLHNLRRCTQNWRLWHGCKLASSIRNRG